jgi:hypothetical protein
MLYRIRKVVAHPDHTVTVIWSDGVEAVVDLSPVIAKGNVFAPLQDGHYFAANMRIADDRLGIEWPNRVDFSADGLRFRAFPEEEKVEFEGAASASNAGGAAPSHQPNTPR